MYKPFVYGMSVGDENFTDRVKETARLRKDFEHGVNVILISPRRMGKTSLVKKVRSEIENPKIKVVLLDVYDCRSEYDFLNRFAVALMEQTSGKMEQIVQNVKDFLVRISPKISFSQDALSDVSLSLGITPKDYTPEEILNLPEAIARKKGIHIVVAIDEFQQVGEFAESLEVQKRMRGVWQHQENVSYCLFGSKKHLMTKLFQSRRMPFYQFGELNELSPIATADWVEFICRRFVDEGMSISEELARRICETVNNQSSYVQQLAWDVMVETEHTADETSFKAGVEALMAQNASFCEEQIRGLSSYQLNFIRALCDGYHDGFMKAEVADKYPMGTKSNINKIKAALLDREIIEEDGAEVNLSDSVFAMWFKRKYLKK